MSRVCGFVEKATIPLLVIGNMSYTTAVMTAKELRQKYFAFFEARGHQLIPSAPLIPEDDPSLLFISAGMASLTPFLLGEPHPSGKRLVNVQKCLRTVDIDEVGDPHHQTFFEMLGNWSLGDYFKAEMIPWSYELITEVFNISPKLLSVTCFAGDKDAPRDRESAGLWEKLGIPKEHIYFFGKKENWWGLEAGGPCGPCSEMFIDTGRKTCGPNCDPSCPCGKYFEIGNDVFMEYLKLPDGRYQKLAQRNVDTGVGLERNLTVLSGLDDTYRTEIFTPIIQKIENLVGEGYGEDPEKIKPMRVVADHVKAASFIIADGVVPSNSERGYILRRLIRRAVRFGRRLGITEVFTHQLVDAVTGIYDQIYPEVGKASSTIKHELKLEEEKFRQTLEKGMRIFNRHLPDYQAAKEVSGSDAFDLYQSYGFPLEITIEMAAERGLTVDRAGFVKAGQEHAAKSRTASAGLFRGGLAGTGEEEVRLHTTTHLLHQALGEVLGREVKQRGSHITAERLRFDFDYPEKLTPDQLAAVAEAVNLKIKEDLPVSCQTMSVAAAKKLGAQAQFMEKYGDQVKVYCIGDYSKEVCGGPHVTATGELGHFKIIKEESVGRGVRRIKATLTD